MGLDIYLYRYDNFEETRRKENEYNEFSEKIWNVDNYDELSQEEKDKISEECEKFAKSLGLDKWGNDQKGKEEIEIDSEKYPDHYFKIGYFRSSYNDSGINRILENFGLPRLDKIFDVDSTDYYIQPDWAKAKERLQDVYEKFQKMGGYRVHTVSPNMFDPDRGPESQKEALDIFLSELKKKNDSVDPEFQSYSNRNGDFYIGEPLKVRALIPGKDNIFAQRNCTYVVTESDNTWYHQAIEIMMDTCDYVLAQPNINQYYLHWSG